MASEECDCEHFRNNTDLIHFPEGCEYVKHIPDIQKMDFKTAIAGADKYGPKIFQREPGGAFHATWRKADRIEHIMAKYGYNIFAAIEDDPTDVGVLDDIRDLRVYLTLWEAEMRKRGLIDG
jgi:hypothetical protein